jgi:hypothetical protein
MKINVTSWRGHHEAVLEPEISKALFNKMTGKTVEALPAEFKTKIPDTWQELEGLWRDGKLGYMAVAGNKGDLSLVKEFDPLAEEMTFIAPQTGG